MTDYTILLVATNRYVNYARPLIASIEKYLFKQSQGQILLFTDQPEIFQQMSSDRVSVQTVKIPSFGWPEATLLRYQFFEEHWDKVIGDFVMYIDVDTEVVSEVEISDAISSEDLERIAMVLHPGYIHNSIYKYFFARSPWGTWETNPKSSAFVPFRRRKRYVAGGVWMGHKSDIHHMIQVLRSNVDKDLNNDYVAKWHDESHLNHWASTHKVKYLNPSWAFAPGYKNITKYKPIIELVHKPQDFFDQRFDYPQQSSSTS